MCGTIESRSHSRSLDRRDETHVCRDTITRGGGDEVPRDELVSDRVERRVIAVQTQMSEYVHGERLGLPEHTG